MEELILTIYYLVAGLASLMPVIAITAASYAVGSCLGLVLCPFVMWIMED